jgi:hypothetical protein
MTGYRSRCLSKFVLFAFVLVVPEVALAAQATPPGQQTVPNWLAWKAFYESLKFYQKRSPEQVNEVLDQQFGVVGAQAARLLGAGQSFLAELDSIDDYAKMEVARRYKYVPSKSGPFDGVRLLPQKSILERAIEDGLYAEVELKKATALANHIKALGPAFDAATLQRIDKYVTSSIASHIKRVVDPTSVTGNPGPPPRPKRQTSSITR